MAAWPDIHVCDLFPGFLDTPGIDHAGNYTGKVLKPAPPVYDPKRVAEAMVKVAVEPKSNKYIGGASLAYKLSHALMPELTAKVTGFMMRRYFKRAEQIPPTSGNLFNTVDYAMSTNGRFNIPRESNPYRKYLAGALIAGVAAGFFILNARNK